MSVNQTVQEEVRRWLRKLARVHALAAAQLEAKAIREQEERHRLAQVAKGNRRPLTGISARRPPSQDD